MKPVAISWRRLLLLDSLRFYLGMYSRVVLVADRGFGRASLFQWLLKTRIGFVVRVSKRVWVYGGGIDGCLGGLRLRAGEVRWLAGVEYHKRWRVKVNLVVKYRSSGDHLYLATNLKDCREVLRSYQYRMWVEEGLRDWKGWFELDRMRLSSSDRVERVLVLVVVCYLFTLLVGSWAELNPGWVLLVSEVRWGWKLLSSFRLGLALLRRLRLSELSKIIASRIVWEEV
ncbi:hypothetical protein DRP53_04950 [candidate division WOR-3 bacterium]|uniref:Transposase IS4-like domain-containing protein n=1 Tax=candidate division WOR-3 bacterium TaxID=2052148 RepID=A0A660SIG2_UNCW3|nr:MAG: hypothetical protein DRP53_04950 [candidate division WOR-3 bacterium]